LNKRTLKIKLWIAPLSTVSIEVMAEIPVSEPGAILLRFAEVEESLVLSELCLRSKAVWGYDLDFLRACRAELTLTPADFECSQVQVAETEGKIVGIAQIKIEGKVAALEKLFVEPENLGSEVGRLLYRWATAAALQEGATVLTIESDPGAAPFYRRMGAIDNGLVPSGSIPGRMLPKLRAELS
jgi:GNAT superfamily N-acetyltransferase